MVNTYKGLQDHNVLGSLGLLQQNISLVCTLYHFITQMIILANSNLPLTSLTQSQKKPECDILSVRHVLHRHRVCTQERHVLACHPDIEVKRLLWCNALCWIHVTPVASLSMTPVTALISYTFNQCKFDTNTSLNHSYYSPK